MKTQYQGLLCLLLLILANCHTTKTAVTSLPDIVLNEAAIVARADTYLDQNPVTITAFRADRSAGGIHDYYSEGSYWWPNPDDPEGPYVRRDGIRNPNNFTNHKNALREFAESVKTLTAAYLITQHTKYAQHAIRHLNAWFVAADTRMNPSLLYAQAIKGISTGRGIGIIDTIRLIDVALSIELLSQSGILTTAELAPIAAWFGEFSDWLTTHPYGYEERHNNNNHSTWWGAQLAAYAKVAERPDLLAISQEQFKEQLDIQMAIDGSFPDELSRTKPFHYMNYNLRGWTTYALLASTPQNNLWKYKSKNGYLSKAIDYALPYFQVSTSWPFLSELESEIHPYQDDFLVFASWGLQDDKYLRIWEQLPAQADDNFADLVLWKNILNHE